MNDQNYYLPYLFNVPLAVFYCLLQIGHVLEQIGLQKGIFAQIGCETSIYRATGKQNVSLSGEQSLLEPSCIV